VVIRKRVTINSESKMNFHYFFMLFEDGLCSLFLGLK
jgi:hypothetical protein